MMWCEKTPETTQAQIELQAEIVHFVRLPGTHILGTYPPQMGMCGAKNHNSVVLIL